MYTQGDFNVQLQQLRKHHTKIEVLNMNGQVIDYIQGLVTSGSLNISNSNMVRRTIDITFVADRTLEIGEHSRLWINKRLRVFIGLEDYMGNIFWYNQGVYVLSNPSTDISMSGRFITVKGYDLMQRFDRPLLLDTKFAVDTKIADAIKGIAKLIDETNLIIEDDEKLMPYDMQFNSTDSIQKILQDVVELYMDYHCYYNVDGFFVFEKIKNRENDVVVWSFEDYRMDLTISRSKVTPYDDIYNYVKVVGKLNDKGELPLHEKELPPEHLFSKENIGYRPKMIDDSKYFNVEQCQSRCEYELEMSSALCNVFSIESIPIYLVDDVNRRIDIMDNGILYKCLVDSIDFQLGGTSMSIQAHEIIK